MAACRLLRLTIGRLELRAVSRDPVPAFGQVPLFGDSPGSYRSLLRKPPYLVCKDTDSAAMDADFAGRETG